MWSGNFASNEEKLNSILAIDCKPELSRLSVLESRDDIAIINPSSYEGCGFNVFYGLDQDSSDDELKERCDVIARTLIVAGDSKNIFFYASAQKILQASLMYGFRKGLSFTDSILKVINVPTEDLIVEIITSEEMKKHPKIVGMVKVFDGKDSDAMQDVTMTLQQDLSIFDTETVKYQFSKNPKMVSPIDLVEGTSIFIAIPDHLLKQYSPIFRLIVQQCLNYIVSIPEYTRKGKRPIWFLIDEAGSIGKLPDILEGLARARSKGVQISLVCQSLAQLESTYGKEGARAIMDCCKTTICFSCNDVQTARDLSARTGTYEETKTSYHQSSKWFTQNESQNISTEIRNVLDVSDIQNLEKNNEVLVFTKGDWFLVEKLPFYKIKKFNEKSKEVSAINEQRKNSLFDI